MDIHRKYYSSYRLNCPVGSNLRDYSVTKPPDDEALEKQLTANVGRKVGAESMFKFDLRRCSGESRKHLFPGSTTTIHAPNSS